MSRVRITDIALNVRQESKKTFNRVIFHNRPENFRKEILSTISPGDTHKEEFDPPVELSIRDRLFILMRYPSRLMCGRCATLTITVELSEVNTRAHDDNNHGRKTFFTFHKNVEVVIGISCQSAPSPGSHAPSPPPPGTFHDPPLQSMTREVLSVCPQFRLLVIGNAGVGKSSLIQKVFGVNNVDVSDASRGRADIEQEFVAEENGLFVLHDSLGVEAAERNNMNVIKSFIDRRRSMEHLKDRLHAVWLCLAIPFAEGRLLEIGMEKFLRDREHILGDIPVIVVLTKLDLLDGRLLSSHEITKATDLEQYRSMFLNKHCVEPLLEAGAGNIPHVPVSTKAGFKLELTIPDLVRTTMSEIERYVKADPSYSETAGRSSLERDAPMLIAGMAQRASIEEKVKLTVTLGKKRYWQNLGASVRFSCEKVEKYILVVHEDIILSWNFNDPDEVLRGDSLKAALLNPSNLGTQDPRDFKTVLDPVTSMVPLLDSFLSDIHQAVLILPIAGAVIISKLCLEIYRATQSIVKRFMAYIVDLIYVMKILFILAAQEPVTSERVALALQLYERSAYRNRIHLEIRDFSASFVILPGGRDVVMEKIEVLIKRFSITDQEVAEQRRRIQAAPTSSGS